VVVPKGRELKDDNLFVLQYKAESCTLGIVQQKERPEVYTIQAIGGESMPTG